MNIAIVVNIHAQIKIDMLMNMLRARVANFIVATNND